MYVFTPISLGITNTYLIQSEGTIYIDGGIPINPDKLQTILSEKLDNLKDIDLIIITHGHFDHIGNLNALKELTNAKLIIHENDQKALMGEILPVPPGRTMWGKIGGPILNNIVAPILKAEKLQPDIILSNDFFDLNQYGVSGYIVHTPGHTEGSVSIVMDDGTAFVGDLAMNAIYLCRKPRPSVLSCDVSKLKDSWEMLLENRVENVHPGHGGSFNVSQIEKEIKTL